MSLIDRFPYGKAPFWLFTTAIVSTLVLVAVQGEKPPRPDLILVTFTAAHKGAYDRAMPEFERRHGVRVQTQFANWNTLRSRLQNAMLAGTDVPDLVEMFEGSLGFFTRGPKEDAGFLDLTDRLKGEGWYDRMVKSRFSLWTAQGRIYGVPHDVHPMMLVYRRDLVEALGIDVNELDTWDKFIAAGRRVTRDTNGDGVIDRYMLELPEGGNWGLSTMLLQRGGQIFDEHGEVAFNSPEVAEVFRWYIEQTQSPRRIAYDCGGGQSFLKAVTDGLALFYWAPDWRTFTFQDGLPRLAGKLALMPIPAWEPGSRRTSVWGGTGMLIAKQTKQPELAWELVKYLYFDRAHLGELFRGTNIIPPLMDAWDLPEFDRPHPYFSNQPLGRLYANLAPETPAVYSAPVDSIARSKLDQAYSRAVEYYKSHGEAGLDQAIAEQLDRAEAETRRMADRARVLVAGK